MNNTDVEFRAREIATKTLAGELDPLLACCELVRLRRSLPNAESPVWDVFEGIASDVDGLPLGEERRFWALAALQEKDQRAGEYRSQVSDIVRNALEELLEDM